MRCRSCGLDDGAHEDGCLAVERAAREKLQAECDHQSGTVTRTTGDPPGPSCCGRCGLELPTVIRDEPVTAETITDEQIRELMAARATVGDDQTVAICLSALRVESNPHLFPGVARSIKRHRADCADIINKRKEDFEIWFVEIVRDESGYVDQRLGPFSRRKAEKVEDGASINLDHDRYTTRIVKGDSPRVWAVCLEEHPMKKITEQTTLAELAITLAELGGPIITLMNGGAVDIGGSRRIASVSEPGLGTFHGGGDTVASAIQAALTALQDAQAAAFRHVGSDEGGPL